MHLFEYSLKITLFWTRELVGIFSRFVPIRQLFNHSNYSNYLPPFFFLFEDMSRFTCTTWQKNTLFYSYKGVSAVFQAHHISTCLGKTECFWRNVLHFKIYQGYKWCASLICLDRQIFAAHLHNSEVYMD